MLRQLIAILLAVPLLLSAPVTWSAGEAAAQSTAPSRPAPAPARRPPAAKPKDPARGGAPPKGEAAIQVNDYQQCLALVNRDPPAAVKAAESWYKGSGGAAARHCAALGLSAQGEYAAAGVILESLARDGTDIPARTRADLYSQAAASWLFMEETQRAESMLDRALELAPGDAELLVQRAEARAAGGRDFEALDDLNLAIDRAPDQPLTLVFRAAAFRRVGSYDLAADDLARAFALDPEVPDAFLERGYLRQAQGDPAGAFRDWLAVLRLEPEGGLADLARRNIRGLEEKGIPLPKE